MAERSLDCRLLRAFAEKDRGGAVASKVLSLLWNVAANESHHVNVCNQAVAVSAQLLAMGAPRRGPCCRSALHSLSL